MTRRTVRTATAQRRILQRYRDRQTVMHARAEARNRHTWYRLPRPAPMTAARMSLDGKDLTPYVRSQRDIQAGLYGLNAGTYAWAADLARKAAEKRLTDAKRAYALDAETEHWADALLRCPTSSLNHRTVRICGKPYHWRQDYTGQLKLAAGESPW